MNSIKQLLLLICITLSFASIGLTQETFTATVVGVVDGDTITVLTKDKRQLMLRLAGIDAPEKEQDFGVIAHQMLSGLILEQTVTVSGVKKDCLGRLRASVAFNKKDLSLMAVKSGTAWADTACEENEVMAKEQLAAMEKKVGLWQGANPVKPSEFDTSQKPVSSDKPSSERRIYSGLAPAPPPPKNSSLYIGMTLEEFVSVCSGGKRNDLNTTETRQSFSVSIEPTPENLKKQCAGNFSFERNRSDRPFTMWMASQN